MTQSAPATGPARVDPRPPPATGLPEAVLAPAGRVPRHEIFATTSLWELHPSGQPSATVLRPSTRRELARWGAYSLAQRCSPPAMRPPARPSKIHHGDALRLRSGQAPTRRRAFSSVHGRAVDPFFQGTN